ncbi:MAG: ECF transporter S component [Oscillospiraceae bacterium]|nr:ECF transporter S component [Oscillospiraceae bacterium]
MKRSRIVMLVMLLAVIPATLLLGLKLPGRSYYLLSALVALEILIPFFMAFEGRKPQPRELVTVAVMSALVTIARVAVPLPSFKPTFAVIMLSGIAFGPETGFIVGALGALGSDFFYGQGPFTPWQMMAYGMAGVLAGIGFAPGRLPRKNWVMGVFCFICTVLFIGPLLDTSTVTIIATTFTWENMLPIYASGLPVNLTQGACSFLTMLLFGNAILEKLERVRTQYGMMETDDDGL